MDFDELNPTSAANLSLYFMSILFDEEINDFIEDTLSSEATDEVIAMHKQSMELAEKAQNPSELADAVRKIKDLSGRQLIVKKILNNQQDTLPLLINKFKRSSHDVFIETSVMIFAYCDNEYIDTLLSEYEQIRDEYAKSQFCVVLGFRGRKDCKKFLQKEYERMCDLFDEDENEFEQGPLTALNALR